MIDRLVYNRGSRFMKFDKYERPRDRGQGEARLAKQALRKLSRRVAEEEIAAQAAEMRLPEEPGQPPIITVVVPDPVPCHHGLHAFVQRRREKQAENGHI